jgi:beta-galactosidase
MPPQLRPGIFMAVKVGNGASAGSRLTATDKDNFALHLQKSQTRHDDQSLPVPVRVKHGINRAGNTIHYYLNYSSDTNTFTYPYAAGHDLLTQTFVAKSQQVTLKPWDLVVPSGCGRAASTGGTP